MVKVDLVTRSRELEDAMLAYYPEVFFPTKQYKKDKSIPGVNFYRFKNLEEDKLLEFLEGYKDCDYIVLGEDKRISNKVEEVKINWFEVLRMWTSNN